MEEAVEAVKGGRKVFSKWKAKEVRKMPEETLAVYPDEFDPTAEIDHIDGNKAIAAYKQTKKTSESCPVSSSPMFSAERGRYPSGHAEKPENKKGKKTGETKASFLLLSLYQNDVHLCCSWLIYTLLFMVLIYYSMHNVSRDSGPLRSRSRMRDPHALAPTPRRSLCSATLTLRLLAIHVDVFALLGFLLRVGKLPLAHFADKRLKCLLYILVVQGARLKERDAIVLGKVLAPQPLHLFLRLKVTLVPDQDQIHVLLRIDPHIFDPLANVFKRLLLSAVVCQHNAVGAPVVVVCDGAEPLLPGRVPNLYLDGLAIEFYRLEPKVNANCGHMLLLE